MRISDWSSDVCSSDLPARQPGDDEEDQDDETDEEQPAEITVVGALAFGLVGGGGARRGFLGGQLNLLGNRAHAVLNAAGHIAGLEFGSHDIAGEDRKSGVEGKGVSGRVDFGGGRIIKKKKQKNKRNK